MNFREKIYKALLLSTALQISPTPGLVHVHVGGGMRFCVDGVEPSQVVT